MCDEKQHGLALGPGYEVAKKDGVSSLVQYLFFVLGREGRM